VTKISIFLAILIVDLVFFIVIRQYFPEGYNWIIATTSYHTGISLETTRSLFIIAGFVVVLICVPVILYFIYNAVKKAVKSF
jgi:hypothetical protein